MRTVEAEGTVTPGGRLSIQMPCDIALGEHRVVVVIDEEPIAPEQPALHPQAEGDGFPGPLTPEKVRRFRAQVDAVYDRLHARGIDPAQLPDPVEELIKARNAGYED